MNMENNGRPIITKEKCPNCGAMLEITEIQDAYPGSRNWETAECPICGCVLREKKTSGGFRVRVIEKKKP